MSFLPSRERKRRIRIRLFALVVLLLLAISAAVFYASIGGDLPTYVRKSAWAQFSKALEDADSITVRRLSHTAVNPSDLVYVTKKYHETFYITDSYTLNSARTKALNAVLKSFDYSVTGGAECHDPGYLLEFRRGQLKILSCTLCLHCSNFEVSPFPYASVLLSFLDQQGQEALPALLDKESKPAAPSPR